MPGTGGELGFYRAMVAIETDATLYYGADATRPALLDAAAADQMLAHLAADLRVLFADIPRCSLVAVGALFDQVEILRPGFPVFRALENTAVGDGRAFRPGLVSIGAVAGKMPQPDLQPGLTVPLGPLQLLPLVIHGPAEMVADLGGAMEHRFLEQGQLSAHSASWLQTAFGVSIQHARLMTLTDLSAMLRLQLDHFGFLALWELLDAALSGRTDPLAVSTGLGQGWEWRDGAAETGFQTFDHWANHGGGAGVSAARMSLAAGYADWTRELRQYLTTLGAHAVPLRFRLAGRDDHLHGTWFDEISTIAPGAGDTDITEHGFGDLGTVAITAIRDRQVVNFYPLTARGLNDIHASLRNTVGAGTLAFPGTILYDEKARRLRPDRTH